MDKDVVEILEIFERVLGYDQEQTIKHLIRQRDDLQARNVELLLLTRELNERLDRSEQMVRLWRTASEELLKQQINFDAIS